MDDWGFGVIWGSELAKGLPYQVFVLQQNRLSYERGGTVRPWTNRELVGTKLPFVAVTLRDGTQLPLKNKDFRTVYRDYLFEFKI